MTALHLLLWGLLAAIALMVLYDFARYVVRHARWRQHWKTDSVSEYHAFRDELDRARRYPVRR